MDAAVGRTTGEGSAPATLDELAARLRERRARVGSPSFSEIARRIAEHRELRGVHPSERSPGRITVYDCFRAGRRRVDLQLLTDIVRALGADEDEVGTWRAWAVDVQAPEAGGLVPSRSAVPAPVDPFVGRERLLAALATVTDPILVTGMPGSGKTQLAARLLHDAVDAGRAGGVISVDLRASDMSVPRATASSMLDSIARTVGVEADTADLDERAQLIAEALARGNLGLLVDDIGSIDQVGPLLARVVATPLVLVSRVAVDAPAAVRTVELEPWRHGEGMLLLRDAAGAARVDAEPDAAADIVDLVGGLPLAVALTAARIAAKPDWTLAEHRDALAARIDALRLDDPLSESIALSVGILDAESARALRLLATLPVDDIPVHLFSRVVGRDAAGAARLRDALIMTHCVELSPEGRLGMHALVRAFAVAQSWDEDPQRARDEALDALADAQLARAWAAAEAIRPGNAESFPAPPPPPDDMEREDAEAWLAAEVGALLQLAEALRERRPDYTIELAHALGWYLDRQGLRSVLLDLQERALAHAEALGDEASVAVAENSIGQTMLRMGRDGGLTHMERAEELAGRAGLVRLEIAALNARAVAAAQGGDMAGCLALFEVGLERARTAGIDEFVGAFLDNIAIVLRRTGDLEGSLARHREAYEIAWERGDALRAAIAMSNLSDDQLAVGDIDAAVVSAERAVSLTHSGGGETHAYALTNLGMALTAQGRPGEAADHHRRALEMARTMLDPVLEASVLSNLGVALRDTGAHGEAVAHFEQALELATAKGVAYERGRALLELADAAHAAGDRERARAFATDAADAFPADGTPEGARARALLDELS